MDRQQKKGFSFAEFEIEPATRKLRKEGEPLPLNAKAFDVLVYLIENAGRVVAKEELLNAVWEGQFVEEANLAVQISALRRVLGDRTSNPRFIATVPGRGYEFVGDVSESEEIIISDRKLSQILVEETITESPDDSGGSRRARYLDSRVMATIVAAGLVFSLGGGAFWVYDVFKSDRQTKTARGSERQILKRTYPISGGTPFYAAISPDGKSLAYVVNQKGQNSLRVGEIAGGNSIQVTPYNDWQFGSVAFSPDGRSLYFTFRDSSHFRSTLMRVSFFGGPLRELITGVDSSVTFSPDGKYLAFIRRDEEREKSSIVIADAETGKNERVLVTRENGENIVGYGISWSPDGTMIAFSAQDPPHNGSAVFAANIDDGGLNKIVDTVDNRIVNVVWSPDQSGLILNRNTSNAAGDGQIWYVAYPGGKPENLCNDTLNYSIVSLGESADGQIIAVASRTDPEIWAAPGGDLAHARLIISGSQSRREGSAGLFPAPDGKIVFCAKSGVGRTIWEMDSDGGNQRQLTSVEKNSSDDQVSVTSDDRFLVFQSDRSGTPQIWRANRDGTDLTELTQDGDNEEPAVTPDGNSVVYSHLHEGMSTLWEISISGQESRRLTTDYASWPAISPDGRFVAFADGKPIVSVYKGLAVTRIDGGQRVKFFSVPASGVLYNRPEWSADGKSIIYKDDEQGFWRQELDKDNPTHLVGADNFRITHFALSSTDLIYAGGTTKRDIVIIDNHR